MNMGSKAFASRTMKVSAVALASALALSACGGGGKGSGPEAGKEGSTKTATNPQDVSKLEKGGTLQLAVSGIGPDFNRFSANGNSVDTADMLSPMYQASVFNYKADGTPVLNKDFMEDAKSETKNGQQVIKYTFNPKAKWNDGTPFDYKTLKNMAEVLSGKNPEYAVVTTAGYEDIEKVEQGSKPNEAIVTMKKGHDFYPWEDLFSDGSGEGMFHPDINSPEIFNKGFSKLHPEWMAGPYKLEKYDEAAKNVSMVPNDTWWGEKPILNKIIFRAMESTATIAAFKNGEVDTVNVANESRYKQAKGAANSEERRGSASRCSAWSSTRSPTPRSRIRPSARRCGRPPTASRCATSASRASTGTRPSRAPGCPCPSPRCTRTTCPSSTTRRRPARPSRPPATRRARTASTPRTARS